MNYKKSGVDIDLADKFVDRIKMMVGETHDDRVVTSVGGFASLYKMDKDRFIAASTDGVGTKIKLAIELGVHDTIGIDLVAMCVNDLICTGARPLFFLDYFASGRLDLNVGESVLRGIVKGCREARLALIGGETAEMPGMYLEGDYDLAGFSVGEVFSEDLIDGSTLESGDTLIGLSSSGFHSNGYSLVRQILELDPSLKSDALTPTKIYVDIIQSLKECLGSSLKGMANITGSGVLNIPRMNLEKSYHLDSWPQLSEVPSIIAQVTQKTELSQVELLKTFNMGVGFVIATNEPEKAMNFLMQRQERAWIIGRVGCEEAGEIYFQNNKI
ncbi:MAG: phosphoribosylformylglycinamidine cyclo-ligase [Bacteriovoracaceae bacterium]|nr:phosphoribosylformylglycinamidine cyclo-ligase [Bacteriovoracaceae bacterium]